jgi:hypothetical protein
MILKKGKIYFLLQRVQASSGARCYLIGKLNSFLDQFWQVKKLNPPLPPDSELKNEWSYTSSTLVCLRARIGIIFTFSQRIRKKDTLGRRMQVTNDSTKLNICVLELCGPDQALWRTFVHTATNLRVLMRRRMSRITDTVFRTLVH